MAKIPFRRIWLEPQAIFLKSGRFYLNNFLALFNLMLVLFLPVFILSEYFSRDSRLLVDLATEGHQTVYFLVNGVVSLLWVLGFFLYGLTIFYAIFRLDNKKTVSIAHTYGWSFRRLFPFIGLFAFYLGKVMQGVVPRPLRAGQRIVRYSLFPLIFVFEGKEGAAALTRSEELIESCGKKYLKHIFFSLLFTAGYSLPYFIILDMLISFFYMKYFLLLVNVTYHFKTFLFIAVGVLPLIYGYLYYQKRLVYSDEGRINPS